jgi:hypothetical protein
VVRGAIHLCMGMVVRGAIQKSTKEDAGGCRSIEFF